MLELHVIDKKTNVLEKEEKELAEEEELDKFIPNHLCGGNYGGGNGFGQ